MRVETEGKRKEGEERRSGWKEKEREQRKIEGREREETKGRKKEGKGREERERKKRNLTIASFNKYSTSPLL